MGEGVLIALEGVDGAGTTTHVAVLCDRLRAAGREVVQTAEPSRGRLGLLLREMLGSDEAWGEDAMALLFAADRLDHVTRQIQPALEAGCVVVSDRYTLSSLAYQSTHLPLEWVRQINAQARRPDLTLLLSVSDTEAAARRAARDEAPERFDGDARQREVAAAYRRVIDLPEAGRGIVVSGEGTKEETAALIWQHVEPLL